MRRRQLGRRRGSGGAGVGVQQGLREAAPEVREPQVVAVHASPMGPVTLRVALRVMAISTVIGVFLILLLALGPITPERLRMWTLYMGFSWSGSILGML